MRRLQVTLALGRAQKSPDITHGVEVEKWGSPENEGTKGSQGHMCRAHSSVEHIGVLRVLLVFTPRGEEPALEDSHGGVSLLQVNGKELSKLSQEQTLEALRASKEPLVIQVLRRSPRLRGDSSCHDLQLVDSGTQTDITFEHIMALGKLRPPTPPMGILEPYVLSEL